MVYNCNILHQKKVSSYHPAEVPQRVSLFPSQHFCRTVLFPNTSAGRPDPTRPQNSPLRSPVAATVVFEGHPYLSRVTRARVRNLLDTSGGLSTCSLRLPAMAEKLGPEKRHTFVHNGEPPPLFVSSTARLPRGTPTPLT